MTGEELLSYVKRKYKRTDKDTEIYEAATDIIADMRLLFHSEDYKEDTTVTAIDTLGNYTMNLPDAFGHLIGDVRVVDTDSDAIVGDLDKISKQAYDRLYLDTLLAAAGSKNTGVPKHFCIYDNKIYVGPVPDSTDYSYTINYTSEDFGTIAAATDPVPFTDNYRNTVRSGILFELHNGMENYEEASYWEAKFLEGVSKISSNDRENIDDKSNVVYNDV